MNCKKRFLSLLVLLLILILFVGSAYATPTITIEKDKPSYYIGEEVVFSGTNTVSDTVYLFIKGSNVDLRYFTNTTVNADGTWSKENIFGGDKYDAGTYTIYAASSAGPAPQYSFDYDSIYATTSITLKQPFLSTYAESSVVKQGDTITISGQAQATDQVMYYIFGTNTFETGSISVDGDAFYSKEITTDDFTTGQYFVVIQHPMYDKVYNIGPIIRGSGYDIVQNNTGSFDGGQSTILFNTLERQSANAAEALCQALNTQNIDDIYVKLTIIVSSPHLFIFSVSDVVIGQPLRVLGTTNFKEGTVLTVDVFSTAFTAIDKPLVNSAYFITQTTNIVKGNDGVNTWEVIFDTAGLYLDTYTIQVSAEGSSAYTTVMITGIPGEIPIQRLVLCPGVVLEPITVTPAYSSSVTEETPVSVSAILTIARGTISSSGSLRLTTDLRTSTLWTVDVYKGIHINNQPSEDGLITSFSSSSFAYTISGFVLDYNQPVTLFINLIGKPTSLTSDINAIKIDLVGGSSGLLGSYSYLYGPARPPVTPVDEITLRSGWNFISVPKTLNQTANTAGTLFGSVDTDDKNILGYNAQTHTWVPLRAADIIQPLNGYWIYAATGTTISLTYPSAPTPPSVKTLSPGWNAVGLSAGESTSAKTALTGTSWRTLIPWNLAGTKYDTAIVNGGSDANSPDRLMTLGNGYWLYVDAQSTLVGLSA